MTTYKELDSYRDDAVEAAERALGEVKALGCLIDNLETMVEWHEEYSDYFDECPSQVHEQLEAWAESCGNLDPYEVEEALNELEEYRELGDLEAIQEALEASKGDDLATLKEANATLIETAKRQGELIMRLATSLDEIDTITSDELAGIGGLE